MKRPNCRATFSLNTLFIIFILLLSQSIFALELEITSSLDPVEDRTALTFTMTVSNPSASPQTNVVLEALVPEYMLLHPAHEATPPGACLSGFSSCSAGDGVRWILGTLSAGEVRVVRFSGVIDGDALDEELLIAEAEVMVNGISTIQDSHTVVTSEETPRLQLAISADHNPARPNQLVTYQLRYSNNTMSPTALTADSLTVTLPVGLSFVSASGGGAETGGVVSWPIAVGAGVDGAREFTVQVGAGLTDGTLLRAEAHLEDIVNGVVTTAADVMAVNATPPLDLMITSSVDPAEDGTALTFTMTVSNPSASPQTNVVLEALVPEYMLLHPEQEATPPGVCLSGFFTCSVADGMRWILGTLAAGEVRVVRFYSAIDRDANGGELLTAEAIVMADGVSTVQDSHTVVTAEEVPPLQLMLSADQNLVPRDGLVTYAVQYRNDSATITANQLTVTLPSGVTFISASSGGFEFGNLIYWPVYVSPGSDGAAEFSVRVKDQLRDGSLLRTNAKLEDSASGITATAAKVISVAGGSLVDLDGDGMPDQWEKDFGLDPYDPSDAYQDPDGDGHTNLEEYQEGTVPNDPGSPECSDPICNYDPDYHEVDNVNTDPVDPPVLPVFDNVGMRLFSNEAFGGFGAIVPLTVAPETIYVLTHGWAGESKAGWVLDMATALAEADKDAIILAYDWEPLAHSKWGDSDYFVPNGQVDNQALNLVASLQDLNITLTDKVFGIGHSLGAGITAKAAKQLNGYFDRVALFDPPETAEALIVGGQVFLQSTMDELSLDAGLAITNYWGGQGVTGFGKAYDKIYNIELVDQSHSDFFSTAGLPVYRWYMKTVNGDTEAKAAEAGYLQLDSTIHSRQDKNCQSGNDDGFVLEERKCRKVRASLQQFITSHVNFLGPLILAPGGKGSALSNDQDLILVTGSPVYASFELQVVKSVRAIKFALDPISWTPNDAVTIEIDGKPRYSMSGEFFSKLSESSWIDISEYEGQNVNVRIGYHSEIAGRELRLSEYTLMIDEVIMRDGFE